MGQDINVDFGLLGKPPDYVGDYTNAFKVGQDLGKQDAGPKAANAMTGAPRAADRGLDGQIAAMSPRARAAASERADLLTGVGQGLKGVPYAERGAVLAHLAPALAARGVPAQAIEGFDPTDDNLDAAVESLKSLGATLAAGS